MNGRIKQPIKLTAAGVHPFRHCAFCQPTFFHRNCKLFGDNFLDRVIFARLQQPLFSKEFVKCLFAYVSFFTLYHHVTSRLRFSARSISVCGVFCVFFIKPCSKIM
ncbi:hypothetical protein CARN8_2650005 [mine drainage metagenome]|uniref:Uncharacterized protein n=1 Tax=mine drainage metagenome TaxID=410659 RepID=A0A3P3ZNI3_9ZZZZ